MTATSERRRLARSRNKCMTVEADRGPTHGRLSCDRLPTLRDRSGASPGSSSDQPFSGPGTLLPAVCAVVCGRGEADPVTALSLAATSTTLLEHATAVPAEP